MDSNRLQVPGQQSRRQQTADDEQTSYGKPSGSGQYDGQRPQQYSSNNEDSDGNYYRTPNHRSNNNMTLGGIGDQDRGQRGSGLRDIGNKVRDGNRVVFMLKGSTKSTSGQVRSDQEYESDPNPNRYEQRDGNRIINNNHTNDSYTNNQRQRMNPNMGIGGSGRFPTLGESPAPSRFTAGGGNGDGQRYQNDRRPGDQRTGGGNVTERNHVNRNNDRQRGGGYHSFSEDQDYEDEEGRERRRRNRRNELSLDRLNIQTSDTNDRRDNNDRRDRDRVYNNDTRTSTGSFVRHRRDSKTFQELEDEEDLYRERERRRRNKERQSSDRNQLPAIPSSGRRGEGRREPDRYRDSDSEDMRRRRTISDEEMMRRRRRSDHDHYSNTVPTNVRRQDERYPEDHYPEDRYHGTRRGSLDRDQEYSFQHRRRRRISGEFYSDDDRETSRYRDRYDSRTADTRTADRSSHRGPIPHQHRDSDTSVRGGGERRGGEDTCPRCRESIATNPSLPRPVPRTHSSADHYACGHLRDQGSSGQYRDTGTQKGVQVGGGGGAARKVAMIPPLVPRWDSIAKNRKNLLRLPFARVQDMNETPGIGLKLTDYDSLRNKRNLPPPPAHQQPTSPTMPMARMRLLKDLVTDPALSSAIKNKSRVSPIPRFNYEHFYNQIQAMITEQEKQIQQSQQQINPGINPGINPQGSGLMQGLSQQSKSVTSILRTGSPIMVPPSMTSYQKNFGRPIGGSLPGSPSRLNHRSSSLQLYSPNSYPLHVQYLQRSSLGGLRGHSLTPPPYSVTTNYNENNPMINPRDHYYNPNVGNPNQEQFYNHSNRRLSDSFLYSNANNPIMMGQRSPSVGQLTSGQYPHDHTIHGHQMAPGQGGLVTPMTPGHVGQGMFGSGGHLTPGHSLGGPVTVKPYDPMYVHPVHRQQLNQPGLLHHPRFIYSDPDLSLSSPFNPRHHHLLHHQSTGHHPHPLAGHHHSAIGNQQHPLHLSQYQSPSHHESGHLLLQSSYPPEPSFADQMLLDSHQLIPPPSSAVTGQPMSGHSASGQPMSGHSASGHSVSGQSVSGHYGSHSGIIHPNQTMSGMNQQPMGGGGAMMGRMSSLNRPLSRSGNLIIPDHLTSSGNCNCCPDSSHLSCCKKFPSFSDVTRPPFLDPTYNLIDKYDYNYENYYRSKRDAISRPYWTSSTAPSRPVTPADINTSPGIHTSKYIDSDDPKTAFKNQMKYFVQERKQALGGAGTPGPYGSGYTSGSTAGLMGETQTGSESDLNALLHLYSHPPDPVRDKFPPPGVPTYQSIPQAMINADQNVHNPRLSGAAMNLINPGSLKHAHSATHGQHQVHWKDGGPTIDYI